MNDVFRIRVGRSIQGFGLSPGITKQQRVDVEALMKNAFAKLEGDLAGNYYPLTGMDEAVRQQLVDDHFLFMSGDPNLKVAGKLRGNNETHFPIMKHTSLEEDVELLKCPSYTTWFFIKLSLKLSTFH